MYGRENVPLTYVLYLYKKHAELSECEQIKFAQLCYHASRSAELTEHVYILSQFTGKLENVQRK